MSCFLFLFSGFVQPRNQHGVPFDTQRSFCRFLGHSTQTDCGSCSGDQKIHHPVKRSLAMCEHTGGVLRDFIVVFHRKFCREHSRIGRRHCLMTEASNSLLAAEGPELLTTIIGILQRSSELPVPSSTSHFSLRYARYRRVLSYFSF